MEVKDFISPAVAEHVESAIHYVSSRPSFTAIIITLDTYGGAADSMDKIIEHIQASPVPVIGFVYPAGRKALSAGVFILMATDLAAMAPYTTIGSSQPVMGTTPINDTKIINAYVKKIEVLAQLHGRNITQAKRFITHNDNLSPEEALNRNVIELVAGTIEDLLNKADGMKVRTLKGEKVLDTKNARVEVYDPSIRVQILKVLSDPIISSILIGVGFLALILGLSSPGWGAEVLGVILLLLGLVGQGLNVNLTAIALMAIGAALLLFEIYTPGFGIIGLGGIITLGIGMALMITQPALPSLIAPTYVDIFIKTVALVISAFGIFFAFILYKIIEVRKRKGVFEPYPKGEGRAIDDLGPTTIGYVIVEGEYWKAKSKIPIKSGTKVRVVGVEDKVLVVEPVQ
ncbi:MAG: nodulation protein NfeD [Nitrososphaerota archaeon]|nr:nodulation protein NfeD [Nitrososphaerales archaeon]MDW8045091.1 nodulation protein NfeD [Nitrososphaerota archaeon]